MCRRSRYTHSEIPPLPDERLNRLPPLAVLLLVLVLGICTAPGATPEISVLHTFAGEPLTPGSPRYRNAAGETFPFTSVSCLLSGFAVEREDGAWNELPDQFA